MKEFLDKDYTIPKPESDYMKFEQGENVFRVLSPAITGYEYWTKDNKPVRSKYYPEETPNIKEGKDGKPELPKHFWAFKVWNVNDKRIQILQITQSSIMKQIDNFARDDEWGQPYEYDIKVVREGEGLETKYTTSPRPKKEVGEEVKKAFTKKPINLEALYKGEDPFDTKDAGKMMDDSYPVEDIDPADLPF